MKKHKAAISCFLLFFSCTTFAQQQLVTGVKAKELNDLAVQLNDVYVSAHQKAVSLAPGYGWMVSRKTKGGGIVSLQGVNSLGFPVYLKTYNLTSAQTTNTVAVQPGGELGLNLSGSSSFLNNKIAIWDGGSVYTGHQEFAGKNITLKDPGSQALDHSTHVAGTLIAKGVLPDAKGMAFGAGTLLSYDFDNDVSKMSAAASGLLISNHSYGDEAGWDFNESLNRWEWYGLPGDTVDYTFGFYDARAQAWDQIAYKAPYYLMVEAAGNAHAYPGPVVGGEYYGYASRTDQTFVNKGPRPANISSNIGFKTISTTGNAKNILTVGAVNALPNGPTDSQDINIAFLSSYGPTNDGRIKPDIVGMGLNVISCGANGPQSYLNESGTSMATPNVAGSLFLLQEYYAEQNSGNFMRSATLKGLACGTAFDAGTPGPDYIYGWGLLNMKKAAQAITDNGTKSLIREAILQQGQRQAITITAAGTEPLIATIAWTDPAAAPSKDGIVGDPAIKLVNDLDVRVSDGSSTFMPWVLNPASPAAAATKGDNVRDNVEQVYIPNAVAGKVYTITVSNKGNLFSGSQYYSIILTGLQSVNSLPVAGNDINLNVYPVPASSQLNISFNINTGKKQELSLVNSAGRTVYSNQATLKAGSFNLTIDVNDEPAGIYIVKMLLDGKLYSRKVIILK